MKKIYIFYGLLVGGKNEKKNDLKKKKKLQSLDGLLPIFPALGIVAGMASVHTKGR